VKYDRETETLVEKAPYSASHAAPPEEAFPLERLPGMAK